jgi:cytochrome c oxidase subunit 3
MTTDTLAQKNRKAKKMMLWFGMISITMTFAGLTSAYVVSSTRADWLRDFEMPEAFTYSTLLIFISSITFHLGKRALMQDQMQQVKRWVLVTLALALLFVFTQFQGFGQIIAEGYYFTGAQSTITTSFWYVLVYYNLMQNTYSPTKILGFELAVTFWHFLDFLWLYLFFFVLLYR